jgi:N-acetylmuramoyl-L-alanine amidase
MNIVCIDPGHGGDDSGAGAVAGATEKDVVLALAKRLGTACRAHNWQVSLTRIDDNDLPARQRAFRANRTGATCFVSLHTCVEAAGAGLTTGEDAPAGGARVIYQGGHGLGFTLAAAVHDALVGRCGWADRGIVAAPRLDLLRWCSIPAVLLELVALPDDALALALTTADGRQHVADALADALARVFG